MPGNKGDLLFRQVPRLPDLEAELTSLVAQVPRGCVATCGGLARALGDVVASRWVGKHLLHHPHTARCPCHRVVRAGGALGGYATADVIEKAARLRADGIVLNGGRVELSRHEFDRFRGPECLRDLKSFQERLAGYVLLSPASRSVDVVGGVDVSYVPGTRMAVAAYAEVYLQTADLVWTTTIKRSVAFPYISSYLAYRELPVLVDLMDQVRQQRGVPALILVDGSGVLHPRRAGIAAMLGVVLDLPTVGVTKKHLSGKVNLSQLRGGGWLPVELDGMVLGMAGRPRPTGKPLFVSPGHRTDVMTAARVVQQSLTGRRLPEPLYWADRISRQEARRWRPPVA